MDTLVLIISSGAISALVSFAAVLLMFGRYKEKIDAAECLLKSYGSKLDALCDRIAKMEGGLERDRANTQYVKRKSPLSLTEKGKALLLDSKGSVFVDTHKDALIESIKSTSPKTAYDVQELARQAVEGRVSEDAFSPIKNYAFKEGLELKDILDVMGVYLRDIALPELGFDISQIP